MDTSSTNNYMALLAKHSGLARRQNNSDQHIRKIRAQFNDDKTLSSFKDIQIFVAGSIGRLEAGSKSDLDVFIISNKDEFSQLDTYKLMARIIDINRSLDFPDFSNDGAYLKVHKIEKLVSATGSPIDDSENMFTTRMLLLLESRYVYNDALYESHLERIVHNYFRDATGRTKDFKPLFILNDLLRYWRTLCLNYEGIRNNPSKPWRKKNINLKFSRMLTVFGTIIPLLERSTDRESFISLCKMTPLERLASSLPNLDIEEKDFSNLLDDYEMFLSFKENESLEAAINNQPKIMEQLDDAAERFSAFIYQCLTSKQINPKYQRYLVV